MEIRRLFGETRSETCTTGDLTSIQPLDFTLLDRHFGNIDDWRAAVNEIHSRGMYVILDNTLSTYVTNVGSHPGARTATFN